MKYHNQKVRVGDEVFDSRREYNRWCELRLLERAGKISDLKRQVRFRLIPAQDVNGTCKERPADYIADFVYTKDGAQIVEDAKGVRTPEYILKRKLMLWVHGIAVSEV